MERQQGKGACFTKKVAVLQSNYIPWKGYFDIIHDVDEFIFYDEVQYTIRDWRNRNYVKTPGGRKWVTVPCNGTASMAINTVQIFRHMDWQKDHWNRICEAYKKAPFFGFYKDFFEALYRENNPEKLSELNQHFIKVIATELLGINTVFSNSTAYHSVGKGHEKLLSLVKSTGADIYISGPAAKDYIVESDYRDAGIQLIWKDYTGYPEYPQQYPPFEHGVSIIDLLLNTGPNAPDYIWGWRQKREA